MQDWPNSEDSQNQPLLDIRGTETERPEEPMSPAGGEDKYPYSPDYAEKETIGASWPLLVPIILFFLLIAFYAMNWW